MDWLNRLLAAVGIGGASVHIELDDDLQPRGAPVRGRVVVEGGLVEQPIYWLALSMVEFQQRPKRADWTRDIDTVMLARDFTALPGQRMEYRFEFLMPDDVRLTQRGLFTPTAGVRLNAEADIPQAVNARRTAYLDVVRHRETEAILGGIGRLGFVEAGAFTLQGVAASPGAPRTVQSFAAQGDLQRLLDGVTADITVAARDVWCALEFNLQEHSAGDRLKALAGKDRVRFDMTFARPDLLMPDGSPNVAGVAEELRRVMQDAVRDPAAPENVLLRPSNAPPPDPSTMVRPASYAPDTPAEQLLRPAQGQGDPDEGRGT